MTLSTSYTRKIVPNELSGMEYNLQIAKLAELRNAH